MQPITTRGHLISRRVKTRLTNLGFNLSIGWVFALNAPTGVLIFSAPTDSSHFAARRPSFVAGNVTAPDNYFVSSVPNFPAVKASDSAPYILAALECPALYESAARRWQLPNPGLDRGVVHANPECKRYSTLTMSIALQLPHPRPLRMTDSKAL
jgi:hypothetical protein